MNKLITNTLQMQLASVEEAPNYNKMEKPPTPIQMTKAIIVKAGMQSGKPSVDIQCHDINGNKFLIFATGQIISMLGQLVQKTIENADKGGH